MFSWWHSLDSVIAFNTALKLLVGILGVVGAFAGIAILVSHRQAESLKLKQSVRLLTAEQEATFLRVLGEGKPSAIRIQYDKSGGKEARDFADQLAKLLLEKNWIITPNLKVHASIDADIPTGITLEFYDECIGAYANPVMNALKAVGYTYNWRFKKRESEPLTLIIGAHPNR